LNLRPPGYEQTRPHPSRYNASYSSHRLSIAPALAAPVTVCVPERLATSWSEIWSEGHARAAISAAVTSTRSPRRTAAGHLRDSELLEDGFDPILGVTEEHLAVLLEEQGFYTPAYRGPWTA